MRCMATYVCDSVPCVAASLCRHVCVCMCANGSVCVCVCSCQCRSEWNTATTSACFCDTALKSPQCPLKKTSDAFCLIALTWRCPGMPRLLRSGRGQEPERTVQTTVRGVKRKKPRRVMRMCNSWGIHAIQVGKCETLQFILDPPTLNYNALYSLLVICVKWLQYACEVFYFFLSIAVYSIECMWIQLTQVPVRI